MHGADMIVVEIDKLGKAIISDRKSVGHSLPIKDPLQNLKLLS
jgi:hypothetical protein